MKYILIAVILNGSGSPIDQHILTAEFETKEICETAGEMVKDKFRMDYICVYKGGE